jgi:hypothetical protein
LLLAFDHPTPIHQSWVDWADSDTKHLAELPALQQLDANEVLQLMLAATSHGFMLCRLPAAQQLSSVNLAEVFSLMAMQQRYERPFLAALQELPGASLLSSEQMVHILAVATQHNNDLYMQKLCTLQAVKDLDNEDIMWLLVSAVLLGRSACLQASAVCSPWAASAVRKSSTFCWRR